MFLKDAHSVLKIDMVSVMLMKSKRFPRVWKYGNYWNIRLVFFGCFNDTEETNGCFRKKGTKGKEI